MIDYKAIGRRIAYYRNKYKMTQQELAELTNVSDKRYISRIETGKSHATLELFYKIALALKIDIADLLRDSDDSSPTYCNAEIIELINTWNNEKKSSLIDILTALISLK